MDETKPRQLNELGKVFPASEAYIIRDNKVLMFKRSREAKRFPGFLIGPGGKIDEGESALSATIREVEEEIGVAVGEEHLKLKAIGIHHHLDLEEVWIAFVFLVNIPASQEIKSIKGEKEGIWMPLDELFGAENVFPPSKFYFEHVLKDKPGIMYTNIQWRNSQLVKVLDQRVDID